MVTGRPISLTWGKKTLKKYREKDAGWGGDPQAHTLRCLAAHTPGLDKAFVEVVCGAFMYKPRDTSLRY